MEWWLTLLIIFAALMVLLAIGLPVAFAFLSINVVGAFLLWNGAAGLTQLTLSVMASVTHFTILPVPLFILMGEIKFRSGIAAKQMDVLDSWMGRIPGRLSLMAVGDGTMFATLTGSAMAGTAMLGKILVPDMEARGYKKPMTLGPILGSGGLAIMIPPSALGVLLAAIGNFSVGGFLMGIVIPGLLMAVLYTAYIMIRCSLQPELAPVYQTGDKQLWPKIRDTLKYVFPLAAIVFLVIGLILMGVATPTESAALGTIGAFVLAALLLKRSCDLSDQDETAGRLSERPGAPRSTGGPGAPPPPSPQQCRSASNHGAPRGHEMRPRGHLLVTRTNQGASRF